MRTAIAVAISAILAVLLPAAGQQKVELVRPANVLTDYLDRAGVHPPVHLGKLTVFPIVLERTNRLKGVLTMAQALERGLLVVEELKESRVNQLRFVNKSGREMVFLMAGELVTGGKQNRALATDALLGPDSATVLPVYCVQRGRWSGAARFKKGVLVVPQAVRERALAKAGQAEIWQEVARSNTRLGVADATEDLARAMSAPANVKRFARLRRRVEPKLPKDCVGVVVAVGDRIVGADLFNSAELFAAMRAKVLDSYLSQHLQAASAKADAAVARPTQQDARRYLQGCYRASFTPADTRGVGQLYDIRGARHGQTLAYRRAGGITKGPSAVPSSRAYMVHTALIQRVVPVKPKPKPLPIRPDRRRGRRQWLQWLR